MCNSYIFLVLFYFKDATLNNSNDIIDERVSILSIIYGTGLLKCSSIFCDAIMARIGGKLTNNKMDVRF